MAIPNDVEDIIEYTKLRKKYPQVDSMLKKKHGFDAISLTLEQMYILFDKLKEIKKKPNGIKLAQKEAPV